jgi:alkyl hydroperoxide reductase subunit AhpF
MALLSTADQARLRQSFATMVNPVRVLFFTQTIGCETCPETRQILDELPALTDRITIEEVNLVLNRETAEAYRIDRAPAIAIVAPGPDGQPDSGLTDSRIRFLGAPGGYEFISLVHAVRLVGGGPSSLTEENRRRIAQVETPMLIQVFTTPT